jgi:hypothetical protein
MGQIAFMCAHCARLWDRAHVQSWGRTQESTGYGPAAVCTALVVDPLTQAGAVCGGPLVATTVEDDADVQKVHAVQLRRTDAAVPIRFQELPHLLPKGDDA